MRRRRKPVSARRRWLLQSIVGLVTLPLSALPIWFYATHTPVGELLSMRVRYEFFPPATPTLDTNSEAFARADRPTSVEGVPVLLYSIGHPTESFDGRYVVSRTNFADQMRALRAAGYAPVRVEQLGQYLRTGTRSGLPAKPVLITFDDARTEAMLQADPILASTGMRAVMFVSARRAASGSLFSEQWSNLSGFASSGRWELENRTNGLSAVDSRGSELVTRLVEAPGNESMDEYGRRTASDLGSAEAAIEAHGAGHAIAFAYPYGNWGQHARPGVAAELRRVVGRRFRLAFDQDQQSGWRPTIPGDDRLHIHRLEVMDWTGPELLQRLDAGAKIGATVFAERGLDHSYTPIRLLRAAKSYRCAGAPGSVLPAALPSTRIVALSFNDGPSPYTPQILHLLEHAHAHATFFVSSPQLAGRARILTRMLADGDEIGNALPAATPTARGSIASVRSALEATVTAIRRTVPVSPCLVRPARVAEAASLAPLAGLLGERVALWSVDPRDFATTDPSLIARRALAQARPGSIITLHDGGGSDRWATVQAIPAILAGLARRGYQVTTVTGLYHDLIRAHSSARHPAN
jgi:peptidoglycan/xylan/chitin deacetylase (PgdA/CDA1 family)